MEKLIDEIAKKELTVDIVKLESKLSGWNTTEVIIVVVLVFILLASIIIPACAVR